MPPLSKFSSYPFAAVSQFDAVLDAAWQRSYATNKKNEPDFVKHLVSDTTIDELNQVAASIYDPAHNLVHFRGGFLHGYPRATFRAAGPGQRITCVRELADALFVRYVTAPGPTGGITVVERSACMLMFKCSGAGAPQTLAFQPGVQKLPTGKKGSDQQQFYLFNRWPRFKLQDGKKRYRFALRPPKVNGTQPLLHDIGKFGVLWEPKKGNTCPWNVSGNKFHWMFSDPLPGKAMSVMAPADSLGFFLDQLVDGIAGFGRPFTPLQPSVLPNVGDWNQLMGFLLGSPMSLNVGYLETHEGGFNGTRDANPAARHFVTWRGEQLEKFALHIAKIAAITEDKDELHYYLGTGRWDRFFLKARPPQSTGTAVPPVYRMPRKEDASKGLPILIATVNQLAPYG